MKRILCTIPFALVLAACGDNSSDESGELATAKAEAAAAKAETAAMKAEMAASGSSNGTASPTPSPTAQKAAATDPKKVAAKGNGKYRMPTADELANGVNANCDVAIEAFTYSGPCKFDSHGGASFTVSRADGYPMNPQYEEIVVEADTNKVAMLSFRDDMGMNTGGVVTRASTKDACWTGDQMKVCAYARKF